MDFGTYFVREWARRTEIPLPRSAAALHSLLRQVDGVVDAFARAKGHYATWATYLAEASMYAEQQDQMGVEEALRAIATLEADEPAAVRRILSAGIMNVCEYVPREERRSEMKAMIHKLRHIRHLPPSQFIREAVPWLAHWERFFRDLRDRIVAKMDAIEELPGGRRSGSVLRVEVDLETLQATVDGTPHDLSKSEQAARWLRVLASRPGHWFKPQEITEADPELAGHRGDRLKKMLPEAVKSLIESETGRGSRLLA